MVREPARRILFALLALTTPVFAASAMGQQETCGLAHRAELNGREKQTALMPILIGDIADKGLGHSLEDGYRLLFFRHEISAAEKTLHAALDAAASRENACAEGLAAFGLGMATQQNDAVEAQGWFKQSEAAFQQARSANGVAHAHYGLASVTIHTSPEAESHAAFTAVAAEFEQAGDAVDALSARLEAVLPTNADAPAEFARLIAEAHELGAIEIEARAYHRWGDSEFSLARYDKAMEHYQQSDALYAACRCNPTQRAYVRTSMGRLERVQGRPQVSIEHYRLALRLQALGHDQAYMPQTLNAISVAYEAMRRYAMAIVYEKRALAYARKIKVASREVALPESPVYWAAFSLSGQP